MKWPLGLLFVFAAAVTHAEPWLCTDEYGNKQFSYEPESAKKKNCVNHPIPSGNYVRVHPRTESTSPARSSFPRVDARTQQRRDAERRQILERELAEERKSLSQALEQLAQQKQAVAKETNTARAEETLKPLNERIRLHRSNISSLEKELGDGS